MNIPHFFIKEFLNSNLDTQNHFIFLYSICLAGKGPNRPGPDGPTILFDAYVQW